LEKPEARASCSVVCEKPWVFLLVVRAKVEFCSFSETTSFEREFRWFQFHRGEFEESAMSSDDPFSLPPLDNGRPRDAINGRIMMSAIIVLVLVLWFVFLLHVYARWFWAQSARFSRRRSASTRRWFHFTGQEPVNLRNVGLDSAVLETLPMFVYKSQNFADGLECAVCLSELKENEKGRLLPNCRHSFHVECIDMWFLSHSTCPLCRTGAQPEQPVLKSARLEQVSTTIPRPIPPEIDNNLNSEQLQNASSGEEYNLQSPTNMFSWDSQKQINTEIDQETSGGRRTLMKPHIAIEIPKRPDGFSSLGEGHQLCSPNCSQSSSKSPVTRIRSLAKMASRDRDKKVFPSDHPAECDVENNDQ